MNGKNFIILSSVPPKGINSGRVEKLRYRCERLLQNGYNPIVVRPELEFTQQEMKLKHGTVSYYGRPVEDQSTSEECGRKCGSNYMKLIKDFVKRPVVNISQRITDPQLSYLLTTSSLLLKLINNNTVCVNTQSYPFTNNLIGLLVKIKRPDVFWLMEYRDPWVTNPNHSDKNIKYISQFLERKCIYKCSKAIYYEGIQIPDGYFEIRYPSKCDDIHNVGQVGYNEMLISNIRKGNTSKFTMIHAGSFWGDGTELDSLFDATQNFVSKNNIDESEFQLVFLGDKPDEIPDEIGDYTRTLGWLPYEQAIEYIKGSDYGLYINRLYSGDELNVSTKMFDYIGCNIPVLCLSRPDWESWEFVSSNEIGMVAEVSDVNEIHEIISRAYYQDGYEISQSVRSKFSREKQFQNIMSLIETNENK